MKASFEGIGERIVTFHNSASTPAAAGWPVKLSAAGTVNKAANGGRFMGICLRADADFAAVRTAGYVKLTYSGTAPTVGYGHLVCDSTGGVKIDAGTTVTVPISGTDTNTTGKSYTGGEYLIVDVDTTAKTVGFFI